MNCWRELAACAGMDTDLFFPRENIGGPQRGKGVSGEQERVRIAKQVCEGCPVRQDCMEYAIEMDCVGIFGGMTRKERDNYVRSHHLGRKGA